MHFWWKNKHSKNACVHRDRAKLIWLRSGMFFSISRFSRKNSVWGWVKYLIQLYKKCETISRYCEIQLLQKLVHTNYMLSSIIPWSLKESVIVHFLLLLLGANCLFNRNLMSLLLNSNENAGNMKIMEFSDLENMANLGAHISRMRLCIHSKLCTKCICD